MWLLKNQPSFVRNNKLIISYYYQIRQNTGVSISPEIPSAYFPPTTLTHNRFSVFIILLVIGRFLLCFV